VVAGAGTTLNIVILLVAVLGPVVAIGIFWFGLRSARRHDERHRR